MEARDRNKAGGDDDIIRFALMCYEKAPSCKCGCGERTLPNTSKKGTLISKCSKFRTKGEIPLFYEIIKGHKTKHELTENQFQAVIASLLGDGYMNLPNKSSKFPRIAWNMGNRDHALYKFEYFRDLNSKYNESENPGWGSKWYQVKTACCHSLVNIYKEFCLQDRVERAKKIFPLLNEVGWAWLYGDDGHYDRKAGIAYIHTEGLGESGTYECKKHLDSFLKMDACSVRSYMGGNPKKIRYMVRLKKDASKKFIETIKPYMAHGLEYKTI